MTSNHDYNSNNQSQNEFVAGEVAESNAPSKASEFYFTAEQLKPLAKFLPPGFSLHPSNSFKPPKPLSKRVSTSVANVDERRVPNQAVEKKKREAYYKAEQKLKEPVDFYRRCEYILNRLKGHRFGFPFLEPVDPEVLGIPDYFQVIKEPMDFSKVEKRLRSGFYKALTDFENDIKKIWENAITYNKPNTEIYGMTLVIGNFFEQLLREEEGSPVPATARHPSTKSTKKTTDYEAGDAPFRPPKIVSAPKYVIDKPLTHQEKTALGEMIRQLPVESLWEVVKIVSPDNDSETLELDIETLTPKVARQLESFLKSRLSAGGNRKTKVKSNQTFKEDRVSHRQGNGWSPEQQVTPPAPTAQPVLGQRRDTLVPPAVQAKPQKEDTSSSSFISDLSKSDD